MKSICSLYKFKYYLAHLVSLFIKNKNSNSFSRCIMYHSIFKNKKIINDIHTVKYTNFKKQIEYLKNFNITHINKINNKPNSISVTFDDGYKDTLKVAYPILKKNKIPFTIFIITNNLINQQKNYLDAKDVKKLAKDKNIIIGSHSKSHVDLTNVNDKTLLSELKDSKIELENIIKKKVTCLSFPYGKFNQRIIKLSKKIGYKTLCNSEPLPNNNNKKIIINRQAIIYYDNFFFFKNKINGRFDAIINLKKLLKSQVLIKRFI